jgi:hypothetical protein
MKKEKRIPGPRPTKPSRGRPCAALLPHVALSGIHELPYYPPNEYINSARSGRARGGTTRFSGFIFCFTLGLFWFIQLSSSSIGFSIFFFFGGDVFLELFYFNVFQNSTFFKNLNIFMIEYF